MTVSHTGRIADSVKEVSTAVPCSVKDIEKGHQDRNQASLLVFPDDFPSAVRGRGRCRTVFDLASTLSAAAWLTPLRIP